MLIGCSIHHHVAGWRLGGRVDWPSERGHHELGQQGNGDLHQLVPSRTQELSHCKHHTHSQVPLSLSNCIVLYFEIYVCVCVCPIQQDEWLSGSLSGGAPLCTVLSNNHNFHFTGKWYDEKCSESSYGFVCEKPQGLSDVPLSV